MDRIVVKTEEDMTAICDWITLYLKTMEPDEQVEFAPPFNAGEVLLTHNEALLRFEYQGEGNVFFQVKSTKTGHEIGTFRFNYGSQQVWDKTFNHKHMRVEEARAFEERESMYLRFAMAWFVLMLFAVYYRPEVERRAVVTGERKQNSKKKGGRAAKTLYTKTYVVGADILEGLPKPRKHSKPSVEYGVRGHYRRYKSGKVIWIRPQVRCKGRKPMRDSTYIAKLEKTEQST